MSKETCFSIFITLLICASIGSLNNNYLTFSLIEDKSYSEPTFNYTEHLAVSITHDDNFTDLGFFGTGTLGDPILISNLNITTTASRGILISDTTKHFVISSCYIKTSGYGIEIDSVAAGTASVINCTIDGNTWDGIYIKNSHSATVINSTITHNGADGVNFNQAPGAIIHNNTVHDNEEMGVALWHSTNSTLTDNTFFNDGVKLYDISVENYRNFTMNNNLVNGKDIGYFSDIDDLDLTIPIYGQLILINCDRPVISNHNLSDGAIGVFLYYCNYAVVKNNTCNNNIERGILLEHSNYGTIENNTCNGNNNGIDDVISIGSTILNNTCLDSDFRGIKLQSADQVEVINNTVRNSYLFGIYIWSSDDTIITNNTCTGTTTYGIYLQSSTTAIISYNHIKDSGSYGILIDDNSFSNIIHHNNFTDNNLGGISQGLDDGTGNVFYDIISLEGNWWSNWNGSTTYPLDGFANNNDPYPLGAPMISEFTNNILILLLLSVASLTVVSLVGLNKRKLRK